MRFSAVETRPLLSLFPFSFASFVSRVGGALARARSPYRSSCCSLVFPAMASTVHRSGNNGYTLVTAGGQQAENASSARQCDLFYGFLGR